MEFHLKLIDVIVSLFFVIGIGYTCRNPHMILTFIGIGTPAMIFYTITTTGVLKAHLYALMEVSSCRNYISYYLVIDK